MATMALPIKNPIDDMVDAELDACVIDGILVIKHVGFMWLTK